MSASVSDLLPRFAVDDILGAGGFATVYAAFDTQLGRPVAIKVLKRNYDEVTRLRFEREAQALSALRHSGIVQVFSHGMLSNGYPYLVMERVAGKSLRTRIEEGNLTSKEITSIMENVCAALDYSHRAGIIHRDLKPENVIVGEDGQAKVVDFGICSMPCSSDGKLTSEGQTVGTAFYMSPEQVQGRPTDARSDIYSVGCIIYECVTGRPPFQGQTVADVMLKHVNNAPDYSELGRRDKSTPALQAVVEKALEKAASKRFATAQKMVEALQRPDRSKVMFKLNIRLLSLSLSVLMLVVGSFCYFQSIQDKSIPRPVERAKRTPDQFVERLNLVDRLRKEGKLEEAYIQAQTLLVLSHGDESLLGAANFQIVRLLMDLGKVNDARDFARRVFRRQHREEDLILIRLTWQDEGSLLKHAGADAELLHSFAVHKFDGTLQAAELAARWSEISPEQIIPLWERAWNTGLKYKDVQCAQILVVFLARHLAGGWPATSGERLIRHVEADSTGLRQGLNLFAKAALLFQQKAFGPAFEVADRALSLEASEKDRGLSNELRHLKTRIVLSEIAQAKSEVITRLCRKFDIDLKSNGGDRSGHPQLGNISPAVFDALWAQIDKAKSKGLDHASAQLYDDDLRCVLYYALKNAELIESMHPELFSVPNGRFAQLIEQNISDSKVDDWFARYAAKPRPRIEAQAVARDKFIKSLLYAASDNVQFNDDVAIRWGLILLQTENPKLVTDYCRHLLNRPSARLKPILGHVLASAFAREGNRDAAYNAYAGSLGLGAPRTAEVARYRAANVCQVIDYWASQAHAAGTGSMVRARPALEREVALTWRETWDLCNVFAKSEPLLVFSSEALLRSCVLAYIEAPRPEFYEDLLEYADKHPNRTLGANTLELVRGARKFKHEQYPQCIELLAKVDTQNNKVLEQDIGLMMQKAAQKWSEKDHSSADAHLLKPTVDRLAVQLKKLDPRLAQRLVDLTKKSAEQMSRADFDLICQSIAKLRSNGKSQLSNADLSYLDRAILYMALNSIKSLRARNVDDCVPGPGLLRLVNASWIADPKVTGFIYDYIEGSNGPVQVKGMARVVMGLIDGSAGYSDEKAILLSLVANNLLKNNDLKGAIATCRTALQLPNVDAAWRARHFHFIGFVSERVNNRPEAVRAYSDGLQVIQNQHDTACTEIKLYNIIRLMALTNDQN
jgi:serine/threonine protein kinase